ncbi:MAG: thiol peroxidase [Candidatus Cloacimonetes bacterium]|nr:thiol peroxidase [Candidatus Cloacimonadota bacterium]
MSEITLKGNVIHTSGELPEMGSTAPDFKLTRNDLSDAALAAYKGSRIVLNIFPSLDTGVCAASVRRFNAIAEKLPDTFVLCISADLPFAQARFCGAEGLQNVETLSVYRSAEFGREYGVQIVDGPMRGLLARAVLVIEADGSVGYRQLVPEIVEEPDYEAVLEHLHN